MQNRHMEMLKIEIDSVMTAYHLSNSSEDLYQKCNQILDDIYKAKDLSHRQKIELLLSHGLHRQLACYSFAVVVAKTGAVIRLFKLLDRLLDEKIDPDEVISVLRQQDTSRSNLAIIITADGSEKLNIIYLNLLRKMINKGVTGTKLCALLYMKNILGISYGLRVTYNKHSSCEYLKLLNSLIKSRELANIVLSLLWVDENKNVPLIALMDHGNKTLQYYLMLLKTIYLESGSRKAIITQLHTKCDEWSALLHIAEDKNPALIYHLIDIGVIKRMKFFNVFLDMKEQIFEYINTFTPQHKLRVLHNALDETHPLGQYFALQLGSVNDGIKELIIEEIMQTEKYIADQKAAIWLKLFYTPRTTAKINGVDISHSINVDTRNLDKDDQYIPNHQL